MKKRVFTMLNFFAFNLLFFAVYLNFIHKDANTLPAVAMASKVAPREVSDNLTTPNPNETKPAVADMAQ